MDKSNRGSVGIVALSLTENVVPKRVSLQPEEVPNLELKRNIDTDDANLLNQLNAKVDHQAYVNPVFLNDSQPLENGKHEKGQESCMAMRSCCSIEEGSSSKASNDCCDGSHSNNEDRMDKDNEEKENFISQALTFVETTASDFFDKHRTIVKSVIGFCLFLVYNIYLGFAIHLKWNVTKSWCEGIKFLIIITAVVYFFILYYVFLKRFLIKPVVKSMTSRMYNITSVTAHRWFTRVIWGLIALIIGAFLIYDARMKKSRLISAAGLIIIIAFGFIFSAHPRKIIWRHVLWGLLLQFLLGLIVLRWKVGQDIFECLGDKIKTFLDFTDNGSSFVFGYLVTGKLQGLPDQLPIFAFKVLSTVIFFSFVISIMYYYGIMQVLVMKVGWFLQATIGTTACESTNAAANIFLGMTEAPLMIKPYLHLMTKSELHAVMTGGFATVAGSVLAAYINFGVNPSHLLSASVMSAPAALGFSKLFYPETEVSRTRSEDIAIERGTERNAIEAAANGASSAVAIVANIAANLIAFLAGVHFLNSNLSWFGSLVGWDFLTFEWLLSQVFRPLAFIMGVPWIECQKVGKLIGLKTIVNEFVAYQELAYMQKHGELSPRSEAISVFALCGFSNIGSIGIMLGGLTTLAPSRKSDMAKVAVRAMIAGSAACFTTACIAGALLDEAIHSSVSDNSMQILPVT